MLLILGLLGAETTDPWALVGQVSTVAVVSAVFAWLWRDEREKRQRAEARLIEILNAGHAREVELLTDQRDQLAETLGAAAQTVADVQGAMGRTVARATTAEPAADRHAVERLAGQVEVLLQEIRDREERL